MEQPTSKTCDPHKDHTHRHGPNCGHQSVQHEDHIDYLHDGHFHKSHGDHVDECPGPKEN